MIINLHLTGTSKFTGYGKLAISLWRELVKSGVGVIPSGTYSTDVFNLLPPEAKHLNGTTLNPQAGIPSLVIGEAKEVLRHWHLWNTHPWLYTMIETDRMEPERVALINRYYRGVMVPSPEQVKVLQDSGVTTRVCYVPMGTDFYVREPVDWRLPGQHIYMTYSLGGSRKGADVAIQAFKRAFDGQPDHQLWIKCSDPSHSWVQGCEDYQIRVIPGYMHELEWRRWLSRVNFFIFPSRGEGRGLPPIEATLEGVPTAATQWLGLWDIADWGYPIPVRALVPHSIGVGSINADGALWADPDPDALTDLLTWFDGHEEEARVKAWQGRCWLLETYPWARTAKEALQLLEAAS